MKSTQPGVVVLTALLLSGCLQIPAPTHVALAGNPPGLAQTVANAARQTVFTPGDWPAEQWWRLFEDPQLDELVERGLADNAGLRVVAARVRRSAELTNLAGAQLGAELNTGTGIQRRHLSENLLPRSFLGGTINIFDSAVTLDYDLDWWDRKEALLQAALGEQRVAEAEHAEAQLLLATAVVVTYFRLQGQLAQAQLADQAVASREQLLRLTRQRVEHGLDREIETHWAETALANTRNQLLILLHDQKMTRHQLGILLGTGPDLPMELEQRPLSPERVFPLPGELTLNLLGRRADVAAQRWRIQAMSHRVDAAEALFYPDINLSAFIGLQSLNLGTLLESSSLTGGAGAALHLPLFDGGRLVANLGVERAALDEAIAAYQQTLAEVAREVADQLEVWTSLQHSREIQHAAVQATDRALRFADSRHQEGLADERETLLSRLESLRQRTILAQLDERQLQAAAILKKVLGGGFQYPYPTHDQSTATAQDQTR